MSVCAGEGPRYGDYKCNHDVTHRVCATLKDSSGAKVDWGGKDFWHLTNQGDWSAQVGGDPSNPGGGWCICMWATARLIDQVGCDNVHLDCGASDVAYILSKYTDSGVDLAPAKSCIQTKCAASTTASDASSSIALPAARNAAAVTPASTQSDNHSGDDSLSGGAIAGIVVGCVVVVAVVVAVVAYGTMTSSAVGSTASVIGKTPETAVVDGQSTEFRPLEDRMEDAIVDVDVADV